MTCDARAKSFECGAKEKSGRCLYREKKRERQRGEEKEREKERGRGGAVYLRVINES